MNQKKRETETGLGDGTGFFLRHVKTVLLFVSLVVLTGSLLLISGCDSGDKEEKQSVRSSLVDIPDCISKPSSSRSVRSDDTVTAIYNAIRDTIGAVEQIAITQGELVDAINEDVLSNGDEGDWPNPNPTQTDPCRVKWMADTTGYDHVVYVYFKDTSIEGSEEKLVVLARLSWVGNRAKGRIIWNMENAPLNNGQKTKLDVTFDGTTDNKTMDIKAVNLTQTKTDDPVSVQVTSSVQDGVFKVSGSYYIPYLKPDSNNAATEARTYSFVVTGYDAEGKGGDQKDKAILKLAVPPAALTDTSTMFTSYSVREVYLTWITEKIKRDFAGNTTVYNAWKSAVPAITATSISTMTNSDVEKVLEYYAQTDPNNTDLVNMMYILKLVNPAYFTTDGFFGTFDGTGKGTLAAVPDWAASGALTLDGIDAIVPATLAAYTFDGQSFEIK